MRWIDGVAAEDLVAGGVKVVRDGRHQVAIFRRDDGSLLAVDNRCPHEGYPLSQGALSGQMLTCCYHNFKFDVTTGACGKGEPLTIHGVREMAGRIEVGLVEPDPVAAKKKRWESWAEAMFEERPGQALRDMVRLFELGETVEEVAACIALWDAERGVFGPGHGAVTAWEALQIAEPGPRSVLALAVPMQLVMRSQVRREKRPEFPAVPLVADWKERLLASVEEEEGPAAEGLLRGALAAGMGREELEPLFLQMCAAHYLDFGHALIYSVGYFDMLDRVGWTHAPGLLCGLLWGVVNGTREDVLPGWARTRAFFEGHPAPPGWRDHTGTFQLDSSLKVAETLRAVFEGVQSASLDAVLDGLVDAAADRLLNFDLSIDARSDVQDDWLSITHCLTFAHAVRIAVRRLPTDEAFLLVLQTARMTAHHRVLDGPAADLTPEASDVAGVMEAMGNPALAVRRAASVFPRDRDGLLAALRGYVLSDTAVRGIWASHQLKTLEAAFREDRLLAVLGAVRFLASPKRERSTERQAREALRFVLEGKTPKLLAP